MEIKEIIAAMSLEEKCSMLSGSDFWHTQSVRRLGIEACMVSDGPHGLRKQDLEADHLGVNESIEAVCLPAASTSACSFDRDLLRQIGEALGDACQQEGVSVILGPAINIKRSPLCGRNFEYFSEDPYLTGQLASSMVDGVQSRNVGTSVKHFAGNSQEHRRMSSDSRIDERTLREIYLAAFEEVVKKARPWTVMCSYNRLNGVYASENEWLLTEVLRKEWGFDGYVVSDWGAVSDRVAGVKAGLDLEMPSSGGKNDQRVLRAVQEGKLEEQYVDQAVERILSVNQRFLDHAMQDTVWDKEAQHALAGRLAAECMVLLKNENHVLPIRRGERVAVIGKFARTPRYQGGGSSHINAFRVTGLLDALAGYEEITYAQGYDTVSEETDEVLIREAVEAAAGAQKAVLVVGLPDSFESEGYDRSHLRLPRCQTELIRRVCKANRNVIVLLYNGSPVEMPWIDQAAGVIEAYLGGENVGTASRMVLYGEVNPSGRLAESFPLRLEDTPSFLSYGGEGDNAVYQEGIFTGYRYYDKKKMAVLFPFGYGLSYTSFQYTNLRLSAEQISDQEDVAVCVDVTNTGALSGKEVVQLYVAPPKSRVFRPERELKGFEKIELCAGETKTVSFRLNRRAFAYWSCEMQDWYAESGMYQIQICKHSREVLLEASIEIRSTKRPERHYSADTIFQDLMEDPEAGRILEPLITKMKHVLGGPGEGEKASEAITEDMTAAMLRYMPLRGLVCFGGYADYDELNTLTAQLSQRPREKGDETDGR